MIKISKEQKENHPEVEEMIQDLKKVDSIDVVSRTTGGQILKKSLVTDIVSIVDTLSINYKTLTMQEFVGLCADMKSKIDLVRVMSRSKNNRDDLEQMIAETLSQ